MQLLGKPYNEKIDLKKTPAEIIKKIIQMISLKFYFLSLMTLFDPFFWPNKIVQAWLLLLHIFSSYLTYWTLMFSFFVVPKTLLEMPKEGLTHVKVQVK